MILQSFDQDLVQLLGDSYFGNGGYATGSYLKQSTNETDSKYAIRKALAQNDNYFKMIADANIIPVFDNVKRNVEGTFASDLVSDSDGLGTSWANTMKAAGHEAELYGCVICMFDTPQDQPSDLLTARDMRTYPYLIRLNPRQIVDYALGGENEIVYMTYVSEYDGSIPIYQVYDNGTLYNATKDKKTNEYARFGEVIDAIHEPQILTFGNYKTPFTMPESGYISTAMQQKAVYRLLSLVNYQAHMTSFSIGHTDSKLDDDFSLGEHSILQTTKGTSFDWKEIPNTMERLEARLENTKTAMFDAHNLTVLNTSANASGKSREYADLIRIQGLKNKAERMQNFETRLLNIFSDITGERADIEIQYPTEFSVGSLEYYIDTRQKLLDMGVSEVNAAEIKADSIMKAYPNKTQEERDAILRNELANQDYEGLDGDV